MPYYSLSDLAQLDQNIRGEAKLAFGKKCSQPYAEFDAIIKAKKSKAQYAVFYLPALLITLYCVKLDVIIWYSPVKICYGKELAKDGPEHDETHVGLQKVIGEPLTLRARMI